MKKVLAAIICLCLLFSDCIRLEWFYSDGEASAPTQEASTVEEDSSTQAEEPSRPEQYHEYAPNSIMLSDINDYIYILPHGEMTEDEGNHYVFETCISADDRERFIRYQNELNEFLGLGSGFRFFLSETYVDRSDRNNAAAFNLMTSVHSWKQILTTLQLIEGDDINYGYVYAKANAVAEQLGWEKDSWQELTDEEITQMLAEDPGRLSLVYPCFLEGYSTAAQIDLAKELSIRIYQDLKGEVSGEAFLEQAIHYAKQLGIPFSGTYLRFVNGGIHSPLVIRTLYVEECISKNLEMDRAYYLYQQIPLPDQLNWQRNITEMIRIRERTDEEIEKARNAFHYTAEDIQTVSWYQWKSGDRYAGWTDYNDDTIDVSSAYVITHEYVHYLHRHSVKDYRFITSWCAEALATYFAREMEYDLSLLITRAEGGELPSFEEYDQESRQTILSIMASFKMSPAKILDWTDDQGVGYYGSYYLIGEYLAEQFGEEMFIQLMMYPEKAEELAGRSMDEIIAEWDRYVREEMDLNPEDMR